MRAVYRDQSDSELLRLHEGRDGLTDAGRQALEEAIEQRGLELDAGAGFLERGRDGSEMPPDEGSKDEIELGRFKDTYQLREMIRLLEEANIAFRVQDFDELYEDEERGAHRETGLRVLVNRSSEREGRKLLHRVLFPTGHDKEGSSLDFRQPRNLLLLSICDRDDGLSLVHSLSEAGVSFYWRDSREDNEVPGEGRVAIEVQAAQQEQAEEALHAWMTSRTAEERDLGIDA